MLGIIIVLFSMSTLHLALAVASVFIQAESVLFEQTRSGVVEEVTMAKAAVWLTYLFNTIPPLIVSR